MKFSRSILVAKMRNALSGTSLYYPARLLYNTLALFNAKQTVQLDSLNVTFWTPTFKIRDDLERLAEKELLRSFIAAIRPGDVVWDVGANLGLYTLFAASSVALSRVVAFEPEPTSRRLLERNILLNNLKNISVLPYALDKETGTKTLFPSATPNPGSHSFVQRTDYRVKRSGVEVAAVSGESLIKEQHVLPPRVLKIDVEGAEFNVLKGLDPVLKNSLPRMLIVEIHPNVLPLFGADTNDVVRLLHSWNFSSISRVQRGTEYHLVCQAT